MKKIILIIILAISAGQADAQIKLFGNGGYNIGLNKMYWNSSTDSLLRISNRGTKVFTSLRIYKDSIPVTVTSNGMYVLLIDTAATIDSNKIKRILPSSLGVVTGTMSGDGNFTIASNIGLQRLIDISADRDVTMPTATEGKTLIVWNANTGAFAWNIIGSVVNAAGTALTTFVNDTAYTLMGTGSEWLILAVN